MSLLTLHLWFDGRELKRIGYDQTVTLELKMHEIESCLGYVKRLLLKTKIGVKKNE